MDEHWRYRVTAWAQLGMGYNSCWECTTNNQTSLVLLCNIQYIDLYRDVFIESETLHCKKKVHNQFVVLSVQASWCHPPSCLYFSVIHDTMSRHQFVRLSHITLPKHLQSWVLIIIIIIIVVSFQGKTESRVLGCAGRERNTQRKRWEHLYVVCLVFRVE